MLAQEGLLSELSQTKLYAKGFSNEEDFAAFFMIRPTSWEYRLSYITISCHIAV